jgi:hypothetical protein
MCEGFFIFAIQSPINKKTRTWEEEIKKQLKEKDLKVLLA